MTRRHALLATCCALLLCATPGRAAGEEESAAARLIKSKAGSVVAVKFVLQVTLEMGGQTRESERNGRALGMIVDPNGLIMLPASAMEVRMGRSPRGGRGSRGGRGGNFNVTSKPSNIRVQFPGSEKEHPAIMGAKDSKYGLAFILLTDMGANQLDGAVDFARTATPRVEQTLYGVSRLGQGFDHAPWCDKVRVLGKATQPQEMWIISGGNQFVGMPLYTADGAVAGICCVQEGVGAGGGSRPFLLPLEPVQKIIARAKTAAEKSLAEIREAEADAEDDEEEDEEEDGDADDEAEEDDEDDDK